MGQLLEEEEGDEERRGLRHVKMAIKSRVVLPVRLIQPPVNTRLWQLYTITELIPALVLEASNKTRSALLVKDPEIVLAAEEC